MSYTKCGVPRRQPLSVCFTKRLPCLETTDADIFYEQTYKAPNGDVNGWEIMSDG